MIQYTVFGKEFPQYLDIRLKPIAKVVIFQNIVTLYNLPVLSAIVYEQNSLH